MEDFDLSLFDTVTEFKPDGTVCDLLRIPQGMPKKKLTVQLQKDTNLPAIFL